MVDEQARQQKRKQTLLSLVKGFSLLLVYEIIEELLEEAIAWTITTVIAKALSFLLVVFLTQTVKVTAKSALKGLTLVIKPLVKKYTYRQGNDKIEKLRRLVGKMKELIAKFIAFLKRNPITNTSTITNVISSLGLGTTVGGALYVGNVAVPNWAMYVIGAIVSVIFFIVTQIGVKSEGLENQQQYDERIAREKAAKEAVLAEKKAKAEQEALLKEIEEQEAEAQKVAAEIQLAEQEKAKEIARKERILALRAQYAAEIANGTTTLAFKEWVQQNIK